ncbi:hypothetical protein LINGRAHAP2_LOCUS29826 [Linum grandiflorum]
MRDLVSCFSESAINISSAFPSSHHTNYSFSCSSSSAASTAAPSTVTAPSSAATSADAVVPSTQTSVSSLYKIHSHNRKPIFLSLTWTHHGLTVSSSSSSSSAFKLNTASGLFRKKKGTKSVDDRVEIHWDLSAAKYDSGRPEPVSEFYLVALVDSEVALVLGDDEKKFAAVAAGTAATASLVSRQEHCSGSTVYSTRARFCESGSQHDILIKCSAAAAGGRHPVLSVSIDKKVVIRVKRLQWNFRGNQTIFVDGLLVDLMWDVHDWFFNPAAAAAAAAANAAAVFMFRTRSGLDSRLWLEEKSAKKEEQLQHHHHHPSQQQRIADFSLLIYASKSP